ncbi:MAG TPA: amidohydrolase family protein, partial [Longimicrobiales bacterium]|nr:amidohydrolase family protein [Longimicrobiales bacterium]
SGLEYLPGGFAATDELIALASALVGTGLPYASHMRNEDDALFAALEEALAVGARAGVPVHVSHLKALGARNWWKSPVALDMIDRARDVGADVTFDVYPYTAYGTSLGATLFPLWAREGGTDALIARLASDDGTRLEAAAREKVAKVGDWDAFQVTSTGTEAFAFAVGRRLGELAAERGVDPWALVRSLIVEDRNRADVAVDAMAEEGVESALAHPAGFVCSDSGARAVDGPLSGGAPHPRTYGAFPRLLGRYVRDRSVLPLEAAVAKVTSRPARRLGLPDRGAIAPGMFADLVAFDREMVADRSTFEDPHRYPDGIPHVMVNGTWVLRDGARTPDTPGRVLRPN